MSKLSELLKEEIVMLGNDELVYSHFDVAIGKHVFTNPYNESSEEGNIYTLSNSNIWQSRLYYK